MGERELYAYTLLRSLDWDCLETMLDIVADRLAIAPIINKPDAGNL